MNLTKNEEQFVKHFLADNGCGAFTVNDLSCDNFSCQTVEDLCEYQELNAQQVGAYLGSLIEKEVILKEPRESENLPDLFWITDDFLEALQKDNQGRTVFEKLKLTDKK